MLVAPLQEQTPKTPTACQQDDELAGSFGSLTIGLPKSVVGKITAKLDRVGIDYSGAIDSPEVRAVVDAAKQAYEQKKERARVASAKRRAAAKEAKAQPEPPMDA